MGRAQIAAGVAATVVFGMVTAAPAAFACDPVNDPGCQAKYKSITTSAAGARSYLSVERAMSEDSFLVKEHSYIEDTADDGLDAYLWIQYDEVVPDGSGTVVKQVKQVMATASGLGGKTPVQWSGYPVQNVMFRACNGPEEAQCDWWRGPGDRG